MSLQTDSTFQFHFGAFSGAINHDCAKPQTNSTFLHTQEHWHYGTQQNEKGLVILSTDTDMECCILNQGYTFLKLYWPLGVTTSADKHLACLKTNLYLLGGRYGRQFHYQRLFFYGLLLLVVGEHFQRLAWWRHATEVVNWRHRIRACLDVVCKRLQVLTHGANAWTSRTLLQWTLK